MWFNFKKEVIVFDCEMSGPCPTRHQLLSIAGIRCDPGNLKVLDKFFTYVGPDPSVRFEDIVNYADPMAMSVNGMSLDSDKFKYAQPPSIAVAKFLKWVPKGATLVSYNPFLDLAFINRLLLDHGQSPIGHKTVDVSSIIELLRAGKPGLINDWSLIGACNALGIPPLNAHTAEGDCELIRRLLLKLLQVFDINTEIKS